jgi:hypothetical protein
MLCVASQNIHAKDPALASLTPDHFKDTATVREDPAAGTATVSTEPGFVEHTGPLRMVWHDDFLTGTVDRKTGRKSFQVAAFVIYSGSFRSYETARYAAAGGTVTSKVEQLEKRVENCATGECTYTEHLVFPIDETVLRDLAAGGATRPPTLWHYDLEAKSGPRYSGVVSTAEVAGLLARLDAVAGTAPVAEPTPAIAARAAPAARQRDLGIDGLAVAATPGQPNRLGILITGIQPGSIAAGAGLITGDIIYELAGRSIKTLADLEGAVSASAANPIALRFFRGLAPMMMTVQVR